MKKTFVAVALLLAACSAPPRERPATHVATGLETLELLDFAPLKGRTIGLLTDHTGVDAAGRATVDVLSQAPGVTVGALFTPEPGPATLKLGARRVSVVRLRSQGVAGLRLKREDLAGLDALVFDMQDSGARNSEAFGLMAMALEEAGKAGLEFFVLDRPAPLGGVTIEGPLLDDLSLRRLTPASYVAVPPRPGMTIGEVARLHNAEAGAKLAVIALRDWRRGMWYDETGLRWVPPAASLPDLESALLRPGLSLFEASNVSVGRGTPWPMRWIGAPWLDGKALAQEMNAALLDGARFEARPFAPKSGPYANQRCGGVGIKIIDRDRVRPLAIFRKLEEALRKRHPRDFSWDWEQLRRVLGTREFQRLIESGGDPLLIEQLFAQGAQRFEQDRKPYLLY